MIEPKKNHNIGWFFDLDGTLINPIFENKGDFKHLLIESEIPEMIHIFKTIKTIDDVYILTGRDLLLKDEISAYLQIPPERVITKDIYLGPNDMKKVDDSKEELEKYLRDLVDFKVRILNNYSKKYGHIIFFEDLAEKFRDKNLAENISVFLPVIS
jgi:FMN phosphatase YigB (HAD superfamily)